MDNAMTHRNTNPHLANATSSEGEPMAILRETESGVFLAAVDGKIRLGVLGAVCTTFPGSSVNVEALLALADADFTDIGEDLAAWRYTRGDARLAAYVDIAGSERAEVGA